MVHLIILTHQRKRLWFRKFINTLNLLKKPLNARKKLVNSFRDKSTYMHFYTKTLTNLIKKYLIKPNKEMTMFITDGVNKKRYVFDFIKHSINWLVKKTF